MKLDESQQRALMEKVNKFWRNPTHCPICGKTEWNATDSILELREYSGKTFVIGGKAISSPVIQIVCTNCGNTLLFNAIKLGLVEKHEEK